MAKPSNRKTSSKEIVIKQVSEFTISDEELLRQRIAEKAHELYECNGCCHGRDVEDWLEAERLVLAEIELKSKLEPRKH